MGVIKAFTIGLHKKDAVTKAGKGVQFAPTVWLVWTSGPLACDRCTKTNYQREAVEKHMYSVAKQTE